MIQLSADAQEVLRQIRVKREAPPSVGLKLIRGTRGELALMLAAVRPGDFTVPNAEATFETIEFDFEVSNLKLGLFVSQFSRSVTFPVVLDFAVLFEVPDVFFDLFGAALQCGHGAPEL